MRFERGRVAALPSRDAANNRDLRACVALASDFGRWRRTEISRGASGGSDGGTEAPQALQIQKNLARFAPVSADRACVMTRMRIFSRWPFASCIGARLKGGAPAGAESRLSILDACSIRHRRQRL